MKGNDAMIKLLTKMLKRGAAGCCPVCGSDRVKSEVKKPFGPFVVDGPTVMKTKCRKCGHSWSMPLRVGP